MEMRKTKGRVALGRKIRNSVLDFVTFEISIRNSSGDLE